MPPRHAQRCQPEQVSESLLSRRNRESGQIATGGGVHTRPGGFDLGFASLASRPQHISSCEVPRPLPAWAKIVGVNPQRAPKNPNPKGVIPSPTNRSFPMRTSIATPGPRRPDESSLPAFDVPIGEARTSRFSEEPLGLPLCSVGGQSNCDSQVFTFLSVGLIPWVSRVPQAWPSKLRIGQ